MCQEDIDMKSTLWSTVAALVIAGAVAIPVIAQPPQGHPGPPGGGRGGGFPIFRELNLSDAQREQIRSITLAQRGNPDSPQSKLADLNKQLHLAILADTPDTQKIEELKTSIATASAEALTARIDVQTRIAQVLTPEQRDQAREALAKAQVFRGPRKAGRAQGM
jgi:Spy/CpxP family protein refolding chaperone